MNTNKQNVKIVLILQLFLHISVCIQEDNNVCIYFIIKYQKIYYQGIILPSKLRNEPESLSVKFL